MSRIGFVSTWFERGAAYVTRQYVDLLKKHHEVFVFARGGESYAKDNPAWNCYNVTWGKRKDTTEERIHWFQFKKWIVDNELDIVFFNEQRESSIVVKTRVAFPKLILGSYIDYYTVESVQEFDAYDFLVCNTKRHYSAFDWHRQCFYLKWGTDTDVYYPVEEKHDDIVFFHSAGMSTRKGLIPLLKVFLETDLHERSKLVVHVQLPIEKLTGFSLKELNEKNVEVIEASVPAPGLYYKGDVYVYPAELDGLGLTLYEALSCGLPIIGTDIAPINEVVDDTVGKLIKVKVQKNRKDNYFWPICVVDEESLYQQMDYFIKNKHDIPAYKERARVKALKEYSWNDKEEELNQIFCSVKRIDNMPLSQLKQETLKKYSKRLKKYYNMVKMDVRNMLTLKFAK